MTQVIAPINHNPWIQLTWPIARPIVSNLFDRAEIEINGPNAWDPQVHKQGFYSEVFGRQSMGLGESYMSGWWDVESLDEMVYRLMSAGIHHAVPRFGDWSLTRRSRRENLQTEEKSQQVAEVHYNLGNEFYQAMLDPEDNSGMQYTCGYFKGTSDLGQAQRNKLGLNWRKPRLRSGMKVLELGSGWGGNAESFARQGCEVVAYNISTEQVRYANARKGDLPITYVLDDYRKAQGRFDAVVSIGLMEHVGYQNYRALMEVANRCLKDDGLFLLHTVGSSTSRTHGDRWSDTYIFPGGMLPSRIQIEQAREGLFSEVDFHNFGPYYDPTLMGWHKNWMAVKDEFKMGERFERMWDFYLRGFAGNFRALNIHLWQIVLAKQGFEPTDYMPVR